MRDVLLVLQIILGVVLSFLILIQVKGASGFGRTLGGGMQSFSRRGLESLVFKFTFVLSFLFLLISSLTLFF